VERPSLDLHGNYSANEDYCDCPIGVAYRRLDSISELHHDVTVQVNHPSTAGTPNWHQADFCDQCGVEMPCPTVEILTDDEVLDAS
jgi:hypothetical protein